MYLTNPMNLERLSLFIRFLYLMAFLLPISGGWVACRKQMTAESDVHSATLWRMAIYLDEETFASPLKERPQMRADGTVTGTPSGPTSEDGTDVENAIKSLRIYVYNGADQLVLERSFDASRINTAPHAYTMETYRNLLLKGADGVYRTDVKLRPGTYKVVVFANEVPLDAEKVSFNQLRRAERGPVRSATEVAGSGIPMVAVQDVTLPASALGTVYEGVPQFNLQRIYARLDFSITNLQNQNDNGSQYPGARAVTLKKVEVVNARFGYVLIPKSLGGVDRSTLQWEHVGTNFFQGKAFLNVEGAVLKTSEAAFSFYMSPNILRTTTPVLEPYHAVNRPNGQQTFVQITADVLSTPATSMVWKIPLYNPTTGKKDVENNFLYSLSARLEGRELYYKYEGTMTPWSKLSTQYVLEED